MSTANALETAKKIQWFVNCGNPLENAVSTIGSWDEWIGLEEELVSEIHYKQQSFHDQIVNNETEEANWNNLLTSLVEIIKRHAPFKESEDAWYAPNIAVWQAAWVLALITMFEEKSESVPKELTAQWAWFAKGRWPCALVSPVKASDETGYIIY
jgi:hypothetical protein